MQQDEKDAAAPVTAAVHRGQDLWTTRSYKQQGDTSHDAVIVIYCRHL